MTQLSWLRPEADRIAGGPDVTHDASDDAAPVQALRSSTTASPAYGALATATSPLAASSSEDASAVGAIAAQGAHAAVSASSASSDASPQTGFSMNLATGQDASGNIQTSGDLADAHWTVSNADNYKQAPIAFTVAPNNKDWFSGGGGNPGWLANGPNSTWIAADPDVTDQGFVTYTVTFDLTGYNPADATLVGGEFTIDDQGKVLLNGHQIGSDTQEGGWSSLHALSNGAGDFVAGINTIVIETTAGIVQTNGARFEGTVVDTVTTTPPGPVHWNKTVSGDFATAGNWTEGFVPSSDNDALLEADGSKTYTVTSSADETVESIQTAPNATLSLTAGLFDALQGSGDGANAGQILVGAAATLELGGDMDNANLISVTNALVLTASVSLTGEGKVTLATSTATIGAAASATLTNVDNTISGVGVIGSTSFFLVNDAAGVIDASGTSALIIGNRIAAAQNAGLIEATGAGGLVLSATLDDSAGGRILAADGSRVVLQGATIVGGSIESDGSGLVRAKGRANLLDGSTSAVDQEATIRVGGHNGALIITGAIEGAGHIELRSLNGGRAALVMGAAANVTLSGGGSITTDDSSANVISGAAEETVTNVDDTIKGAGSLGAGRLILVNEAGGVIDGAYAVGLNIDTGVNTITNAGLIEATAGGALIVSSALDNTGILLAAGGGTLTILSSVTGDGFARIHSGTIDAGGGFDQDVDFNGGGGTLELANSQTYSGVISGFSHTGADSLDLADVGFVDADEATWRKGVLTVTDGTHTAKIALAGNFGDQTFVASDDGHGGVLVVATTPGAQSHDAQSPAVLTHHFSAAMASLAHPAAALSTAAGQTREAEHLLLVSPRLRYA